MRNSLWALSVAAVLAVSTSAHATTFTWSYTDGGANFGSGTLDATQDVNDLTGATWLVSTVSGTAQGEAVTGTTGYGTADNRIYWQPGAPAHFDPFSPYYHVDYYGLGLTLANGDHYAIYEEAGIQPTGWSCGGSDVPYCLLGPNTDGSYNGFNDPVVALTDFVLDAASASQTPLPAALPLFGTGLGALALFASGRRKKRVAKI